MKCLLLDEVIMDMANFNVDVCSSTELFVRSGQSHKKSFSNV